MGKLSTTQLSTAFMEGQGYHSEKLERWNSFARIRQDVAAADIISFKDGEDPVLIQVTTKPNMKARKDKILQTRNARIWIRHGLPFQIHGWYKVKNRWKVEVWTLKPEDVDATC
jgi:hypothetical protein